jgi:hypothetical protein
MAFTPEHRKRDVFAILSYSNMLTLNAIIQLLSEKGLLTAEEIMERVAQLEKQEHGKTKSQ